MINLNSSIAKLSFIYTQESFYPNDIELQGNKQVNTWMQEFKEHHYVALYRWRVQEKSRNSHSSATLLY